MSGEGINPGLAATQANIAQELMEEDLKRELERNQLATKMAMAKENEAQEAKVRAQNAQVMMHAMLQKYEEMKNKLDGAKTALQETATKTLQKEEIIDKIQSMKERIESYSNRKEAVNYLQDHVQMKFDHSQGALEWSQEETDKYQAVQKVEEEKAERVKQLQEMMRHREKQLEKQSQIKVMLERQLEIGEKKAAEHTRVAIAREKLLELKMKELQLQKAKLARKKIEQEEKERATEDFIAMIDKQLEDMESNTTDPREKREAISSLIEKHFNEKEKKEENVAKEQTGAIPKANKNKSKKVKSPEPSEPKSKEAEKKPFVQENNKIQNEEKEKMKSPEPVKSKNAKKKNKNKNKNKASSEVKEEKEKSVEVRPEVVEPKTETKVEPVAAPKPRKTAEQLKQELDQYLNKSKEEEEEKKKENKLTEEEVKNMVAKVEDKCQTVRDDIANMAMSEQYLRTKQALLKAKKKEQEMEIAQRMASLREEEVTKMREKVTKMQELLASRRQELHITEEIIHEKDGAKKDLDKKIEASLRRQNFVEKKIVERVMFQKPRKKK